MFLAPLYGPYDLRVNHLLFNVPARQSTGLHR
jgi:hypothetical protein